MDSRLQGRWERRSTMEPGGRLTSSLWVLLGSICSILHTKQLKVRGEGPCPGSCGSLEAQPALNSDF